MFWERCFVEEYYRKNVQNKMGGKSPGGATRGKALPCRGKCWVAFGGKMTLGEVFMQE